MNGRPSVFIQDRQRRRQPEISSTTFDNISGMLRITSPKEGHFLDIHAQELQRFEVCVKNGFLQLDEYRQRHQMTQALEFYTRTDPLGQGALTTNVLSGALKALGAEWGIYYELEEQHNALVPRRAIRFEKKHASYLDLSPGTSGSIREQQGMTHALFQCQCKDTRDTSSILFVLHVPKQTCDGRQYVLEVFSENTSAESTCDEYVTEYGYIQCRRKGSYESRCRDCVLRSGIALNPHTRGIKGRTRIAFAVRDADRVRGIAWIQLADLRDVAWWERQYIYGLSKTLLNYFNLQALHVAVDGFRHMVPDVIGSMRSTFANNYEAHGIAAKRINAYLASLKQEAAVVRVLNSAELRRGGILDFFDEMRLSEWCETAIGFITDNPDYDRNTWRVSYSDEALRTFKVRGIFFSVLTNLLANIQQHGGWEGIDATERLALIHISRSEASITTTVANSGRAVDKDPLESFPSLGRSGHGIGLFVMKELLFAVGGSLRNVREFPATLARIPDAAKCSTFFEFSLPYAFCDGDNR